MEVSTRIITFMKIVPLIKTSHSHPVILSLFADSHLIFSFIKWQQISKLLHYTSVMHKSWATSTFFYWTVESLIIMYIIYESPSHWQIYRHNAFSNKSCFGSLPLFFILHLFCKARVCNLFLVDGWPRSDLLCVGESVTGICLQGLLSTLRASAAINAKCFGATA